MTEPVDHDIYLYKLYDQEKAMLEEMIQKTKDLKLTYETAKAETKEESSKQSTS
jgi:hypothetical protein